MRGSISRLVFSLLLLSALAACEGPADRIVGKWQPSGGTSGAGVWEFSKNGGVKTPTGTGKYSFGDRKRLKIQTPFATFVYEVEISDDTMKWRDPNGSTTELTRVP
jgi:hypothetical protein